MYRTCAKYEKNLRRASVIHVDLIWNYPSITILFDIFSELIPLQQHRHMICPCSNTGMKNVALYSYENLYIGTV